MNRVGASQAMRTGTNTRHDLMQDMKVFCKDNGKREDGNLFLYFSGKEEEKCRESGWLTPKSAILESLISGCRPRAISIDTPPTCKLYPLTPIITMRRKIFSYR